MASKQIKNIQVIGGYNSANFTEFKVKLQCVQSYLQTKQPNQNPLKNIEFIELDESDFLQRFIENQKLFPQLYQLKDASETQYAYILSEQSYVFLQIDEFFNHYKYIQKHFKFIPLLNGEKHLNYVEKSKQDFLDRVKDQFHSQVENGNSLFNYLELEATLANGQQKHINLIVDLNKKLCPKAAENFSSLVEKDIVNEQGEKISLINSTFYVKRKEFLQGGRQNIKGHSTIFGQHMVDESFTILPDRPGILALVNQGIRDSNITEFFITLEDLSYQNLNNICFGKIIYGIEELLDLCSNTENSETLEWKIARGDVYTFDERDFIQDNGIMRLNQQVSIKQQLANRQKDIEKKLKTQQEEEERREEEEKKLAERQEKEKFQSEIHEYKKKLYHDRKVSQKNIEVSQSKTEFQLAQQLKTEIIHSKDSEKQQHIDQYLEHAYACRKEHKDKLKEAYEKLMEKHVEDMKKYGVQFPTDKDYDDHIYHVKLRESNRIKQLKQDQSVFNVQYVSELPKPEVKVEGEEAEGDAPKIAAPKIAAPIVFGYIPVFEDLSYLYPDFIFLTKYQLLGKYARIVTVLDRNTNSRYILKQFSDNEAFENEKKLIKQLQDLIEAKPELGNLIAKVHLINDNTKVIQYEGGECSLTEYTETMALNNTFWFQDKQKKQLNQIITQLYKMLNEFFTNKLYFAANLRPENLVLFYDSDFIDLQIKIVDCGGLSIEDFSQAQSQIAAYSPHAVVGFEFNTEEDRQLYELYLFGRIILKLMIDTISYSENQRYNLVSKVEVTNFDAFFESFDPENNKVLMEKIKGYFDEFHLNLLNCLLTERDKTKTKKQFDILRKDAKNSVYQLFDYDNFIRENNKLRIPLNLEYEECVLVTLEQIQNLELYELSLKIIKQQSKEFQKDPWIVFYKINAYFQLNWDNKLKKYVEYLQKEELLTKIETQDPEYFHRIYLLSMKSEYNDINNEEHMQKIEAYLRTFNSYFETQQGEMSEKHIKSLILQGQFLQSLVGKITNKQPQIIQLRKLGDKVTDHIKKGNNIPPIQQAQVLFLKSFGYPDPSEETKQQILTNLQEAQSILENAQLTRSQIYCQVLQNIYALEYEKSQDDEQHMANMKKLLKYQQRNLGGLEPSYAETMGWLAQYFHKNKAKLHIIPLQVTDMLYHQCLSVVQAKYSNEQIEKLEFQNLKGSCGQENQLQHLKDYLNKALEWEQQQRFAKAMNTYKAAEQINSFHLQKKKDFEDNQQFILKRIEILGDKLRILDSEDKENIRLELLSAFIDKHEEFFNSQDTYFYLSNIFPYLSVPLENNFQVYVLECHRLKEKMEKLKSEPKKWSFEYGVINIYNVYCHLKMHQRHIMTYYLHAIEEIVGGEWQNSGLLKKKNQVPLGTLQRISAIVQVLSSYQYKLESTKYTYLNI